MYHCCFRLLITLRQMGSQRRLINTSKRCCASLSMSARMIGLNSSEKQSFSLTIREQQRLRWRLMRSCSDSNFGTPYPLWQRTSLQRKILFRLGMGYKLKGIPKVKLGMQCVGPFEVVEKVGKLAYRLRLPDGWKIHPVISIVHLEPAKEDPFDREVAPPPPMEVEGEE